MSLAVGIRRCAPSYTLVHCLRELMLAKLIHRISWIIMRLPVTRNAAIKTRRALVLGPDIPFDLPSKVLRVRQRGTKTKQGIHIAHKCDAFVVGRYESRDRQIIRPGGTHVREDRTPTPFNLAVNYSWKPTTPQFKAKVNEEEESQSHLRVKISKVPGATDTDG